MLSPLVPQPPHSQSEAPNQDAGQLTWAKRGRKVVDGWGGRNANRLPGAGSRPFPGQPGTAITGPPLAAPRAIIKQECSGSHQPSTDDFPRCGSGQDVEAPDLNQQTKHSRANHPRKPHSPEPLLQMLSTPFSRRQCLFLNMCSFPSLASLLPY